jgi:HlyD family secretion protein
VLAKVTNPHKLKAVLKIPETQARDLALGQQAKIDTRSTIVAGHLIRIDPAAESGTVTVDVALDGPLPREARPDLGVDGTIELERIENALYVGRPVYAQSDQAMKVFKLTGDGLAVHVPVKFGRTSVTTIEIVEGLEIGDRVIVSDTHEWDDYDRLRIR